MIAPAGHHCNVRSGHLNATFGGKDMGSRAQTGLLLVPSDALGHTWALPGVLGAGQGLPPESGPGNLNARNPGEVLPRLSGFLSGRVNPRCWGEPRRDCVSCSHSRLEVPRQRLLRVEILFYICLWLVER